MAQTPPAFVGDVLLSRLLASKRSRGLQGLVMRAPITRGGTSGTVIAGYDAPGKGNTLMNDGGLDVEVDA